MGKKRYEQMRAEEILTPEKFMGDEKSILKYLDRLNISLELIKKNGLKILDVGGASGVFLNELVM